MRRVAVAALATALAAAPAASIVPAAAAAPPRPADLHVVGGGGWRAENSFRLAWDPPPAAVAAVNYLVRDPGGAPIAGGEIGWVADGIGPLTVPRVPGAYGAEVWFEDEAGEEGPAATATLRFDDVRPGAVEPPAVPGWIGRAAFPLRLRLAPPGGPVPLSGVRGYAVAIDASPGGEACAAPDRCSDAETTLRGGPHDDTLSVAALPEGTSHLHAVAVSGSGMKSASAAHATLRVDATDPRTRLFGAPAGWTNRAATLVAIATDSGSGMAPDGSGPPPIAAIAVDGRPPRVEAGSAVAVSVIGEGVHRVAYHARDAAGNADDGGPGNRPPRTALVRIDRGAPRIAFANAQRPAQPELIRARLDDALSGPDLDRGWIGLRRAGSGDRFARLPPAPAVDGELRAHWESDAFPAGRYELKAVGYDRAGNGTATTRRANGKAMVLSNPLKAKTRLGSGWARRAGKTRAVRYGRGARLRGRLIVGGGAPLAGMPVRIVERFLAGAARPARASTARTGRGGRFSVRLAPGPSREVVAVFAGGPTLSRSRTRPLLLRVRSRVRLRRSAAVAEVGGAPLVFRGRVAAPPGTIPAGGKSVQLQFRLRGRGWTEFRTVQTDRRGRFRLRYRFSDDDSRGVRFQFRAYAPAQEGWPFAPGGSAPVFVRGR